MARCTTPPKLKRPTVSNMSEAEKLIVARRRSGQTQEAFRGRVGLTRRQYQRLESGRGAPSERSAKLAAVIRSIEDLEPHERCFLFRHRAGETLAQVGKQIAYTEFWVGEMERGAEDVNCDVLLDYWMKRTAG